MTAPTYKCANPSCLSPECTEAQMEFMDDTNIKMVEQHQRQFGGIICHECADAYPYLGPTQHMKPDEAPCPECAGGPAGVRKLVDATGQYEMDWCAGCNGTRVVKKVVEDVA